MNFTKSSNITFYVLAAIIGTLLFLLFNKSDWGRPWMGIIVIVVTAFVCWTRYEMNRAVEYPGEGEM
jgi:hypothetical protein